MRAGLFFVISLMAAGCYQPKLTNYGFACDSQAPKPCPDGYFCRNGFCDDGSGGSPPATGGNGADDMAMSQGGGGGGGGGGGNQQDMAMSIQDMAQPPKDFAQPKPDMVMVSSCPFDECTIKSIPETDGCSACVTAVCSHDTYCCSTKWDTTCVNTDVPKYCATTKTCP